MNTKAFVTLLVVVLVMGGGLGGAFVGGIALGKSQEADAAQVSSSAGSTPSLQRVTLGESGGASLDDLRRRFQSGEISPEEAGRLRQQFQGRFGPGGGGGFGLGGGGGLSGAIEKVEGNTVTVNTPQGPLQATVDDDTAIQRFAKGTVADLQEGTRVTVIGQPGEDGSVRASVILITPEGADGGFGGGIFRGLRRPDRQSP